MGMQEHLNKGEADMTETKQKTAGERTLQVAFDLKSLTDFMPKGQWKTVKEALKGEEKEWFQDKMAELAEIVKTMPKVGETDSGKKDDKIVYLRYFWGNGEAFIFEKDFVEGEPQCQAFGIVRFVGGYEDMEYVSLPELFTVSDTNLDFHFTPTKWAELKWKD